MVSKWNSSEEYFLFSAGLFPVFGIAQFDVQLPPLGWQLRNSFFYSGPFCPSIAAALPTSADAMLTGYFFQKYFDFRLAFLLKKDNIMLPP